MTEFISAFENFKRQVEDLSDDKFTEKQLRDLWNNLPENEKIFFYNSPNGNLEDDSDEICSENIYDGLKKSETKLDIKNTLDDCEFMRNCFLLPKHFLGSVKKQECGYKANVFRSSLKNEILKVKTIEYKHKNRVEYKEDDNQSGDCWVYNLPSFNFNSVAFKNFIIYTYYNVELYKQNKYKTLKIFLRANKLTENKFVKECKLILTKILLEQDHTLSIEDVKLISDGLYNYCDLNDFIHLYETRIKNITV